MRQLRKAFTRRIRAGMRRKPQELMPRQQRAAPTARRNFLMRTLWRRLRYDPKAMDHARLLRYEPTVMLAYTNTLSPQVTAVRGSLISGAVALLADLGHLDAVGAA